MPDPGALCVFTVSASRYAILEELQERRPSERGCLELVFCALKFDSARSQGIRNVETLQLLSQHLTRLQGLCPTPSLDMSAPTRSSGSIQALLGMAFSCSP